MSRRGAARTVDVIASESQRAVQPYTDGEALAFEIVTNIAAARA